MLNKTLFNAVVILAVSVGSVSYLNNKKNAAKPEPVAVKIDTPTPKAKTPPKRVSASVVSIPKNPRTGQYHFKGRVNSGYIDFLVDTGASAVALTLTDARKAGIRDDQLNYTVPVNTAGGRIYAAKITLDRVALGGISLRDVDAFVIREGLETSLLGMTWLGQLQEVKATPNALMLRL